MKAKNVTPEVRREKWDKGRPIAPQTKHPMRKLFHMVGRALSFITSHLPGEHFVINHGMQVPEFIQASMKKLQDKGDIHVVVKDITGCFPNMPKDAIKFGIRSLLHEIKTQTAHDTVVVPHKDTLACEWKTRKRFNITTLPFETIIEVMEFALENTFIKDNHNQLWQQIQGIPMGDPHSPGMTIGTCAWMEKEWMATLSASAKANFSAARYMDDIIMFYVKNDSFDDQQFLTDFTKSDCYWSPLELEDGKADTFLETTFSLVNNTCRYWIKNENQSAVTGQQKIWRYAHYHSYGSRAQKLKTLKATLTKLHKLSSDDACLYHSARCKLCEFQNLRYPPTTLAKTCNALAISTANTIWFKIRNSLFKKIPA